MKSAALTQVRALHVMMVFVQVIEWNGIHGNLFDSSFKLSLTELIPNVNLEGIKANENEQKDKNNLTTKHTKNAKKENKSVLQFFIIYDS